MTIENEENETKKNTEVSAIGNEHWEGKINEISI